MVDRQQLEQTASLAEAVELLFGRQISGRTHLLPMETMEGQLAWHYHQLGLQHRQETYREIGLNEYSDVVAYVTVVRKS